MTQRISGPGVGLPPPQNLYPSELYNVPYDLGTPRITLTQGQALEIPAGDWLIGLGSLAILQWLDPVSNTYRTLSTSSALGQPQKIFSAGDGTLRVINPTEVPVAAVVAGGGTSFTQATVTITANIGGSEWNAIVGGSLAVASIVNPGAGFTLPPLVLVPDPPTYGANGVGGVPAAFYALLNSGTVSAVVASNVGAGYQAATITGMLVPSQFDPNFGAITPGSVTFTLTNAGLITAALCQNSGAPLSTVSALTLTAAGGAGTGATITPVVLQTISSDSIVAGGAGWGTATDFPSILSTGGGVTTSSAVSNPIADLTDFVPRRANISATTNAGGTITAVSVIDSGLFASAVTAAIAPAGTVPTAAASITFAMGGGHTTVMLQPL